MSLLGKWFGFTKEEVFDGGVSAYSRGDYEAAIDAFEECLSDATDNATARLAAFYLGDSYGRLGAEQAADGAHADALTCYRSALRYCPNYPDLHLRAAKEADAIGDEEARDFHLRSSLRINPRYVDAHVFQGVCEYQAGNREPALERIALACEADSQLDIETFHEALNLHREGRFTRALDALRQLAADMSNDAALHKRVAEGFLRDGLLNEAAEAYRKTVEIEPRCSEAYCRLGLALLGLRRYAEALEAVDQSIRLNPAWAEAHAQRGAILREMKREIDARCEFQRAFEIDPNHPSALRESASLL